jgi:hypothetical protein
MTRQEAYQPIDHEKSAAESTTDRLRNIIEPRPTNSRRRARTHRSRDTVGRQVREYGEEGTGRRQQFKPFVQKLKEQPMTTLAGAAVIGFLLEHCGRSRAAPSHDGQPEEYHFA